MSNKPIQRINKSATEGNVDLTPINRSISNLTSQLADDYDKQFRLKAGNGFGILEQKLDNKVTEYISKNGKYLYVDRIITKFNKHVVEDLRITGVSLYKNIAGVYSKTWSEGCTIESLQNFSVTLKRDGTVTIRTVPYALPTTLRGIDDTHCDILTSGEILRKVGEVKLDENTTFQESDVLINDANRIVFKIPNEDIDMVSKKFMVQGYVVRPDNASAGVGVSDVQRSLVLQLPVSLISSYAGANSKEKALNYLAENPITILYAKETPVKEPVNVKFPHTQVNGDLSTEIDSIVFKPVIEAKVAVTRDEIKDYIFNKNGVKYNGQLKREGVYLVNSKGKPIQLRGIGTHHLLQYQSIQNYDTVLTLKYYGVSVLRLTAYPEDRAYAKTPASYGAGTGYLNAVNETRAIMVDLVNACRELGMYVIVDWHVLENDGGGRVATYQTQAEAFFRYFSDLYPNDPHVIYEILNEPFKDTSVNIANFTSVMHSIVIQKSPNAVFIVGKSLEGLPSLHTAINNLNITPNNIFLSPHFYFSPNQADWVATEALQTEYLNLNIPIFCSEFGNSEPDGDGERNDAAALALIKKFNTSKISWCVWKLTYQDMTSSLIKNSVDAENGYLKYGGWTDSDFSYNGKMMFNQFYQE